MVLLAFSWLLVFKLIKTFYQPYWSYKGLKLALLLLSEFLMLFIFVLYFCVFTSGYIIPTFYVIMVFLLSNAISVYLYKYQGLSSYLYQIHLDKE